ncbi:hypothetical protein ACFYY8_05965 [Streptosporangium sp. NPDC001559]|uniref:hypothetical protein n=1 Tax=Streptosporangium sp. NPDC001559 TaxID=3366187 RepID=UPI0036E165A7
MFAVLVAVLAGAFISALLVVVVLSATRGSRARRPQRSVSTGPHRHANRVLSPLGLAYLLQRGHRRSRTRAAGPGTG